MEEEEEDSVEWGRAEERKRERKKDRHRDIEGRGVGPWNTIARPTNLRLCWDGWLTKGCENNHHHTHNNLPPGEGREDKAAMPRLTESKLSSS